MLVEYDMVPKGWDVSGGHTIYEDFVMVTDRTDQHRGSAGLQPPSSLSNQDTRNESMAARMGRIREQEKGTFPFGREPTVQNYRGVIPVAKQRLGRFANLAPAPRHHLRLVSYLHF